MPLFSKIYCQLNSSCRLRAKIARWTMHMQCKGWVWVVIECELQQVLSGLSDSAQLILKLHFHSKNYLFYSLCCILSPHPKCLWRLFQCFFHSSSNAATCSALPHKLVSSISDAVYHMVQTNTIKTSHLTLHLAYKMTSYSSNPNPPKRVRMPLATDLPW